MHTPPSGHASTNPTRRTVVVGAAAFLAISRNPAMADADAMRAAMNTAFGGASLREGRVTIDIPALVENGNSVAVAISVESPMTREDHVRAIHVFSPENPLPVVSRFALGPRCGKAEIRTTIRLATTQVVHVVAEMSDTSLWLATAEVEVTTAACFDPT